MTRFGPRREGKNIIFSLWAPDAPEVFLLRADAPELKMRKAEGSWHEAVVPGGAGMRYRFRIGDTVFPDPASRRQEGGVHGWSVVTALEPPLPWPGRPWRESVVYECHAGLMGGFAGVAARLPGLAEFGITVLELMPIAAFPGDRNWGYDGVLSYAIAEAYGTPEDLQDLIRRAHDHGISVLLDVVYNHFGPDGNYLPLYAKRFYRDDKSTPWGAAIDFRVPEVRQFFADNARHWLFEVGFDGLRFDAVHAIVGADWLDDLAGQLRREAGARPIHLVLENEDNGASHLRHGFDAQWNDDIHHAFHVLLTGETHAYYQDFARVPAALLAKGLAEGFIYQGQASANRGGAPRGEASADLPPTAFVNFLQNHDQTGNRPFGERLTTLADPAKLRAAVALLLLAPQIPMLFMGEEWGSRSPFLFFTDHGPELAQAVREGRRREFAVFAQRAGTHEIPDPNAPTNFVSSDPAGDTPDRQSWLDFYRQLLALRAEKIMPRLDGAKSLSSKATGKAVLARWRMGDGQVLTLACNLGSDAAVLALPAAQPFFGPAADRLAPATTLAWLTP